MHTLPLLPSRAYPLLQHDMIKLKIATYRYKLSNKGENGFMKATLQRVAHRGGARLAPENTLAAFRNALTLPIDAIELDVQLSRDGQPLVFHDATVERLTDGQGNLLDLDFAYLRSLNAAAHFPGGWPEPQQIPTLREVLELVRHRAQVYVELKASQRNDTYARYPYIARTVVNELRATNMLKEVLIISFDWALLHEVRLLEDRLQTAAVVSRENWPAFTEPEVDRLLNEVTRLGVSTLSIDYRLFTKELLTQVHQRGFQLSLWTVNEQEDIVRLAAAGVDALTSDRPDLFASI
jgi:glycerophosphoryl diester phosphodiesterase